MEDVYHMTLVSWPKLPWVSCSSVSSEHLALDGRTWIFPSQAVCVTYWINIFLTHLLGLRFTITFLSLWITFHCTEKNFLSINSSFVWRPAPIFKIWLYQHALGLMPKLGQVLIQLTYSINLIMELWGICTNTFETNVSVNWRRIFPLTFVIISSENYKA